MESNPTLGAPLKVFCYSLISYLVTYVNGILRIAIRALWNLVVCMYVLWYYFVKAHARVIPGLTHVMLQFVNWCVTCCRKVVSNFDAIFMRLNINSRRRLGRDFQILRWWCNSKLHHIKFNDELVVEPIFSPTLRNLVFLWSKFSTSSGVSYPLLISSRISLVVF